MADAVDQAQAVEELLRSDAIAHRSAVPKPGQGSDMCDDCGNEVHEQRAALGYRTCIECARLQERRRAGYR